MSEQPKDDKHWEQYRKPKGSKMKLDLKNISIGVVIGIISTTSVFFLIGDIDIETEIQLGEKANQENKNISISIEKNTDDNGEEIVNVVADASGNVTKEEIENQLSKLYAEKNIDISSANINVEINLNN